MRGIAVSQIRILALTCHLDLKMSVIREYVGTKKTSNYRHSDDSII